LLYSKESERIFFECALILIEALFEIQLDQA